MAAMLLTSSSAARGIGEVRHHRQFQLSELSDMERNLEGRRMWMFVGTKARFEMGMVGERRVVPGEKWGLADPV